MGEWENKDLQFHHFSSRSYRYTYIPWNAITCYSWAEGNLLYGTANFSFCFHWGKVQSSSVSNSNQVGYPLTSPSIFKTRICFQIHFWSFHSCFSISMITASLNAFCWSQCNITTYLLSSRHRDFNQIWQCQVLQQEGDKKRIFYYYTVNWLISDYDITSKEAYNTNKH